MSGSASEVFGAFLKLGLTSFGGPVAHLGYFRNERVDRRKWLDERAYADLVALCQFLPGPASSQVGIAIGLTRAPSFLLVIGVLPFWDELRRKHATQATLRGINAAVVGLLIAAFYNPVWTAGILSKGDLALAAVALRLLLMWRTPPWLVVLVCAGGGQILAALP